MSMREIIEHSMRIYIRFLAKQAELFKTTIFETMHNSPRLAWLTRNVTIPCTKKSLAIIRAAQKERIYPDMKLFYLILGASRYMVFVAPEAGRVFGKDLATNEEIKQHEDAVIRLFISPERL